MFLSNRKSFIVLSIISIFIFSPWIIRNLLIHRKFQFLNNLYFNSPILIVNEKECKNLEFLLNKHFDNTFSASVIDPNGNLIGKYNDKILRLPASNLKLFTTGYIINRSKTFESLETTLYKNNNDEYYLEGSVDPDLTWKDIRRLISFVNSKNNIKINLVEITKNTYWPEGWTYSDRNYEYGAPISLLALNSNENTYNDIYYLKDRIYNYLKQIFPKQNIEVSILSIDNFKDDDLSKISSIKSNQFLSLITLSNSISHNFTAESLYKNISKTWGENNYKELEKWLKSKGLPLANIKISDASGLSRENQLNTNLIALFLNKMQYSNKFDYFKSSLSILGVRGTLAEYYKNTELNNNFFGKTCTLSDSFALSGYLYNEERPYVISIIQNSNELSKNNVFNFLIDLYNLDDC